MNTPSSAALRWQRIVQEHQVSGLTAAAFCRRRGLTQPSFYAWRRRLRGGAEPVPVPGAPPASAPGFVELKIAAPAEAEAPAPPGALEVLLPGGRRVLVRPGFDPALLGQLVAALEARA